MYTMDTTSDKFAHYIQTQSISTYKAQITPTATQLQELQQVNPELLMTNHFNNLCAPMDPMKPLADTPLKSLNFDETISMNSELVWTLSNHDKKTLLLCWHYHLGHLPFSTIINLGHQGIIDKHHTDIETPPLCAGCQYGKQTWSAWQTKSNKKLQKCCIHKVKHPGEIVSADTMNSWNVPGLIAQLWGQATPIMPTFLLTIIVILAMCMSIIKMMLLLLSKAN